MKGALQLGDGVDLCVGKVIFDQGYQQRLYGLPRGIAVKLIEPAAQTCDGLLWPLALGHQPAAKDFHFGCLIFGASDDFAQLDVHLLTLVHCG